MFFLPKLSEYAVDAQPLSALLIEHGFAVFFQRVVFPLPAALGFGPAGLNEAAIFQAVQHGVEHAVGPFHLVLRALPDFLDDGVAVAFALREQRQDEGFGRRGDEFFA